MPDYRLTKSVKEDLIGIAQCGDDHYGVEQSDRYRDQLKQRFSVLAINQCFIPLLTISAKGTDVRVW